MTPARPEGPAKRRAKRSVASSAASPRPGEHALVALRAGSEAYAALIRNMEWSFEAKGLAVQRPKAGDDGAIDVDGLIPTLIATSERARFVVEFATGPMLENPHLAERLGTFQRIPDARLWLVVPSDDWAEARAVVARLAVEWQVIVGDR